MRSKNYNQKRIELKEQKREGLKSEFEDTKSRKRFIDGVKRTYRALKRSEKQVIKKQIDNELN
jgi:hypothetical protein